MSRILIACIAAALTALFLTGPVLAQETQDPAEVIAALQEKSRTSYEEGRPLSFFIANRKLNELRPYEPEYIYNMARACALLGRKGNAYEYMMQLQQQGLSYDFDATEDTVEIRDSEAYAYINQLLVQAGKPAGDGFVAFTVPGDPGDFEAIEYDETRQKFLLGTLLEGKVIAVAEDGSSETLLQADKDNGLWSIHGLAVDKERNRLWVSSSAGPDFGDFSPAIRAGSSLSEFSLDTLELLNRLDLPADDLSHKLGSIAVSDDGHVYVIDRANPIVYRKAPGKNELEAFVASKDLVELTDIAVTAENSRIFVSDRELGIWVIDPVAQQAGMMSGPETLNLGGISAIEFSGGKLLMTQSGIKPERLVRLQLDNTGSNVSEVAPMAIALGPFDKPGTGVIKDGNYYYYANSGSQDKTAGAIIMRSPLDAGANIEPPDMLQFKQQMSTQPSANQNP